MACRANSPFFGLLEIIGFGIAVDIVRNFINPGEGCRILRLSLLCSSILLCSVYTFLTFSYSMRSVNRSR